MSQPLNLIHDALVFVDDGIVRTLKRHRVPKVAGVSSERVAALVGLKNVDLNLFSAESWANINARMLQEGLDVKKGSVCELAGVLSTKYNARLITVQKKEDGSLHTVRWSHLSLADHPVYIYQEEGKEWEALIPPPVGEAHYVVEVGKSYQLTFILDTKERNIHITKITATHIEGRDEEGSNSWSNDRLLCVEVDEFKVHAAWVVLKEGEEALSVHHLSILNSQEQAQPLMMDQDSDDSDLSECGDETLAIEMNSVVGHGVVKQYKQIKRFAKAFKSKQANKQLTIWQEKMKQSPVSKDQTPIHVTDDYKNCRWRVNQEAAAPDQEFRTKYEEFPYGASNYLSQFEAAKSHLAALTVLKFRKPQLPARLNVVKNDQNSSLITQRPPAQLRPRTAERIPSSARSQATIHAERNEFGVELSMPQQNPATSTSLNGLLDPPEITNSAFFSGLTPLSAARRNLNTNISTIQTINGDLDCSKSAQNSINNLVSCVFPQTQPEYPSTETDRIKEFDDEIQKCNSPLFPDPEPLASIVSHVPIGSLRVPTPKRTGTPHSFRPMADQAASPISTVSGSELVDGFRAAVAKRTAPEIKKPQPFKKQKPMQALLPNVMRSVVVGSVPNVTQTPLASIVAPASIRPALGLLGSVPNVTPANLQLNLTSKALASCLVALPGFKNQLPAAKAEPFLVESVLNAIVLKDPGFLDALFIEIRQYPLSGATLAKQVIGELLWPTALTLSYNP